MSGDTDKKMSRRQVRFLNLQKAFDALYHDIVLIKFYEYVSRDVNNFWKRHLDDPAQYISISGETTAVKKMKLAYHKRNNSRCRRLPSVTGQGLRLRRADKI